MTNSEKSFWDHDTTSALTAITNESQEYLPADAHVTSTLDFLPGIHNLIDIERYSQYKKLLRITAYVMTLINKCRAQKNQEHYDFHFKTRTFDRIRASYIRKDVSSLLSIYYLPCRDCNHRKQVYTSTLSQTTETVSRRHRRHSLWGHDTQRAVARTRQIPIYFTCKTCVDPPDCHRRSFFSTSFWCYFSHHSSSTEVLDPVDSPVCPVSSPEVRDVQKSTR